MNLDLFKSETAMMIARKSVTVLAAILVERGITMSKDWYGAAQEIVAGLIVFAISWALSKWHVAHKNAQIDNLQTVVDTKTVETQVLRGVVADQKVKADVMETALIVNDIPIPVLAAKPDSIEALAAALHSEKAQQP